MITIELNNNKIQLRGNLKVLNQVYEKMAIRHPNAFFIRPHMPRGWDGKIHYLTDKGQAKTGLLPMIVSLIEEIDGNYMLKDMRAPISYTEIPSVVGEFEARDYQIEAAESIVYNQILDIPFQRGIIGAATNAGKTLIAALIYKSFPKSKCLILVNNTDLYKQFLDDMPKMFGHDWGYMQGKDVKWSNIMICMTPTLRNNLDRYSSKLASYNMVIFDECHLMTSKTNKKVVTALYNTVVRVGLSGTPFDHKDKTKNMDVRSFFGDEVYKIKNIELMEMGYSTPIVVKMVSGNTKIKIAGDYDEEYRQGITQSRERESQLISRLERYLSTGRYPILIVGRYHEHVERLYDLISDRFGGKYRINFIHHKIKERKEILDLFKEGKVDILIASLIIKLGQNMPMIKCMINAASGDSAINALQLVGRAIRIHKSKKKVYFEDFFDTGAYLSRHSKHRLMYYKREGFKVLELYKETRKPKNTII
jgi:superfamily II DNA or RNA helicase